MDHNDPFNFSFTGDDGTVYKMRSLSTPEDFIKEARRDEWKKQKLERKAAKRIAAFGEDDERAQEFLFAAKMVEHSANGHREVAEMLRKQGRNDEE